MTTTYRQLYSLLPVITSSRLLETNQSSSGRSLRGKRIQRLFYLFIYLFIKKEELNLKPFFFSSYCVKTINAHDEWVKRVIINDDASFFATCSYDQTIKLWSNGAKVECTETLRGHSHVVECIALSPANTPILGVDEVCDQRLSPTSNANYFVIII
jgi:WD40 repeat protein